MSRKNRNKVNQTNPKKPGNQPESIVIQHMDVRPFNRKEQTISTWRKAHQSAESLRPQRNLLYNLFADVELDGQVEAVTSKRVDAVTGANWAFVDKDGKPVDKIMSLIDSLGFDEMIKEIMSSKWWGYAMMEPDFYQDLDGDYKMSLEAVPKLHMRPELGRISYDGISDEGKDIRTGYLSKVIMEVGNVHDLGLHLKGAPFAILKRGGWGDYAMFTQVFGQPIADAKYDGFNTEHRQQLIEMLSALGLQHIVRPDGTEIDLLQTMQAQPGTLHKDFIEILDKAISKTYLNTTETVESSRTSGYAQSETHQEQDDDKHANDIEFVRKVLNDRFKPILATHGFDVAGGKFIAEDDSNYDPTERIKIYNDLAEKHNLPIEHDHLYEEFHIPKPDNYDQIMKDREAKEKAIQQAPDPSHDKQKKSPKEVEEIESQKELKTMFKALLNKLPFFRQAPDSGAIENPCCEAPTKEVKLLLSSHKGAFQESTDKLMDQVGMSDGTREFYSEPFILNATLFSEAFQKGWISKTPGKGGKVSLVDVGFEYRVDPPAMQAAFEANLFRFSAIRASYQSREVNDLFRQATSFSQFKRLVNDRYGVKNKQWLETEYHTAYAIGETSALYHRLLGQIDTFPYWEIRTIGDEKVRAHHRVLHGRILPANHAIFSILWPPFDWNCRCYIVPRLGSEVDTAKALSDLAFVQDYIDSSPAWQKAIKKGFGANPAITLDVFSEVQMYSDEPQAVMSRLNQLTASDWALLDVLSRQSKATKPKPGGSTSITGDLKDYAGRSINRSSGLQVDKVILEAIDNPDELWFIDSDSTFFNYVKYYQDGSVIIKTRLSNDGTLDIINHKPLTESERKGLLIKS